jgi:hypothetical protein
MTESIIMAATNGNSEDGGLVQASPSSLQGASHPFHMVADQIADLSQTLQTTLQWMLNDVMLTTELLRYTLDIQQFGLALQISMECQVQALQRIGFNLDLAGFTFEGLDLQLQQRFEEVTFPGFEPDSEPNGAVFRPQMSGLVQATPLQTPTPGSFEPDPVLTPETIFTAIAQEHIAHSEQSSPSFQPKQQNPGLQTDSSPPSWFAPDRGGTVQHPWQPQQHPAPEGLRIGLGISFPSEEEP